MIVMMITTLLFPTQGLGQGKGTSSAKLSGVRRPQRRVQPPSLTIFAALQGYQITTLLFFSGCCPIPWALYLLLPWGVGGSEGGSLLSVQYTPMATRATTHELQYPLSPTQPKTQEG